MQVTPEGVLQVEGSHVDEMRKADKETAADTSRHVHYHAEYELPRSVDATQVKATYKDGLLSLMVPKPRQAAEAPQPVPVPIAVA